MANTLPRVLCTFPDCCRVVALRQFKRHFVAYHLRETLAKYSHDADDCRISDAMLTPEKPKKKQGRRARASIEELQELKNSFDKIEKTLAALSKEMVASKSISSAAAVMADPPPSDHPSHTRESFVSTLTVAPGGKCPPIGSLDAARPIGKVAPASRPQKAKRQLEGDLDEDSVAFSIPVRDVKTVDERAPPRATAKPSCVSLAEGVRPSKQRRAEAEEETTAKAEVIVTMMSSDGVPDVTRTLRGSRVEANSAVRRTWMDANRAGVLCELESDKDGYCRLVIQNSDGTEDSIEARKVRKTLKFRKLFASSDED